MTMQLNYNAYAFDASARSKAIGRLEKAIKKANHNKATRKVEILKSKLAILQNLI